MTFTTQIWVARLIGRVAKEICFNQSKALLSSHLGSERHHGMEFMESLLRRHFPGNQWWRLEILAVFSGYLTR